jgi:CheY-like chemotaxis protein
MEKSYTFLVIDDSYIDRLVSGMMIRHTFNSTEVYEVSGGQPALEWLRSDKLKPENDLVILLDIMMPQMNGFEFLIQFDKLMTELKNNTTVVMLSSTLDHDDIRQAKNHPYVKKFLSKPLLPNQLQEFLKSNL